MVRGLRIKQGFLYAIMGENRMIYTPKHFHAYEFVPERVYKIYGEGSFFYINSNLLRDIDKLREDLDLPVIVNDWYMGGICDSRGYRPYDDPEGAKYSQHRLGCAVDFVVSGMTAGAVRKYILDNQEKYPSFRRMEMRTAWVHVDCKETSMKGIHLFKP